MRPLFFSICQGLVVLVGCGVSTSWAADAPTFPYKAYVTNDDVYVRSGPGQSYYPTDRLQVGQEVEVYRHDPGGWYAIRPPEGSFSWVSGRYLQPGIDNLAVVGVDRLAARVGSRFSDARDVIQVRLHQAEVVEVLEKKRSEADPENPVWYKIAPPSGEFRWVNGRYLSPEAPEDGLRTVSAEVPAASVGDAIAMEPSGEIADRRPTAAVEPGAVAVGEPAYRVEAGYEPAVRRLMTPEQYEAALEAIDLELSVMVIEEPTVWAFDEMQHRAESLLEQAETAVERGRARVLLNKLAKFDDIKRRYDAVTALRVQTERTNRQLTALYPSDPQQPLADDRESRFDGVGELIRVVSPKLGAPRYALVDPLGEVICYVSPAPGVPLAHYLGRRVGVNGTRGYMPEQRARHVMAQHVSALDDTRIR